jgi:hypothetical protein
VRQAFDEEAKRLGLTEAEIRMRIESEQKFQIELNAVLGTILVKVCCSCWICVLSFLAEAPDKY